MNMRLQKVLKSIQFQESTNHLISSMKRFEIHLTFCLIYFELYRAYGRPIHRLSFGAYLGSLSYPVSNLTAGISNFIMQ